MEFNRRLESFLELKNKLKNLPEQELNELIQKAKIKNPWFTDDNIKTAFTGIISMLNEDDLKTWTASYHFPDQPSAKNVGVVMAGNIPLVGFHDFLSVLISGHRLMAKLSAQDDVLLPFVADLLIATDQRWKPKINFVEKLQDFDAVIATGSDNSSRYFEYYFKTLPRIIRKNRVSAAVVNGKEQPQELKELGEDIYRYFGLGCRNVSKIFLPQGYDIKTLLDQLNEWSFLTDNHKFANNYNYNQAIFAMERIPYLDNGFSIFTESDQLASPTAVVYYEHYKNLETLQNLIASNRSKIQCIVSSNKWFPGSVDIGKAQYPRVWEYADDVDTVAFLLGV